MSADMAIALAIHRRARANRANYDDNGVYIGPPLPIPPPKDKRSCACSEKDEIGRPRYIGLCPDDDCEGRYR